MAVTPTLGRGDSAALALGRVAFLAGWAPLAALALAAPVLGDLPLTYRYVPLVASVVFLGLPHGAVDYVALPRARTGRVTLRGVAVVSLLYLVLGGAYLLAWFLAPVAAAVRFLLLTWGHWGQGDVYVLRDLYPTDHVDDAVQWALTVLVRGGLPMLVPLLAFPDRYRTVVGTFVDPFGASVDTWWLFGAEARGLLALAFGLVCVATLVRGWLRSTDARGWSLDAGEVGLLWVVFLLVPPVLAIGIYFCLWHSVRHIVRVALLDERNRGTPPGRHWTAALRSFALEAAGPTVLALGLLGGLWLAVPGPVTTVAEAAGLYLVAIAVLTLPHVAVVSWLDALDDLPSTRSG